MDKNKFLIKFYITSLISIFFCFACTNHSKAEQTIINMPSSEVVPLGQIIIKSSAKISPFSNGLSSVITPVFTFGGGKGTEFSAGVGTTIQSNTLSRANLSAKKVFFIGSGSRLTIGGSVNPYLTETATPDTLFYTHFSQRIKKTRTSITAGAYIHGQKHMPHMAGAMLGVEQTIIPNKLRAAVDWISSDNSYGKFGVGLKYRPVPSVSMTTAIIIPNKDPEDLAFSFSISKFLSLPEEIKNKEFLKWDQKKSL